MSVSGAWLGARRIPGLPRRASFLATLTEDESGRITGLVEEADIEGLAGGGVLYATVEGHRRGDNVIFVRTPENANAFQPPMQFVGSASNGRTRIEGSWLVAGRSSGPFEMERVADGMAEAERAAFVFA